MASDLDINLSKPTQQDEPAADTKPPARAASAYRLSIIMPAKNEEQGLAKFLPDLRAMYPDDEIIVVNDGSTDGTVAICEQYGVKVHHHPQSMGNGAAIKSGARVASGDVLVFMDADGQHDPADIQRMLLKFDEGYDMVVGARDTGSQASVARWAANTFYNRLASLIVGKKVEDLTSGFRAVRADKFKALLYILPNGFSYPTTSTMAFFRSGYQVSYIPIKAAKRLGKSHINLLRDGSRFVLIIFKIGTLYSPLKVFIPIASVHAGLGLLNYAYTFVTEGRFTNMSAVLLTSAVVIFLIGLVSEQITLLTYSNQEKGNS